MLKKKKKKAKGAKPEDFLKTCVKIYKIACRNYYKHSKIRLCLWHLWYCIFILFFFKMQLIAAIDKNVSTTDSPQ